MSYDEEGALWEVDIFKNGNESTKECQKRKARLDALEDLRNKKSLRKQIDYLYDKEFINLNQQVSRNKKR